MLIAVETADLVGSTQLSTDTLDKIFLDLDKRFIKDESVSFQRFRGDAFQITYCNPVTAIKSALLTRLRLIFSLDTQSIGLTQSLYLGVQDDLNQMGSVYVGSGRQLDAMPHGQLMIADNIELLSNDFKLATEFVTRLISQLTMKQAETLYHFIEREFCQHQELADFLNTSRQNISTHLSRANADLIKKYILRSSEIIEGHKEW